MTADRFNVDSIPKRARGGAPPFRFSLAWERLSVWCSDRTGHPKRLLPTNQDAAHKGRRYIKTENALASHFLLVLLLASGGCFDALTRRTDRQIYDLISERQQAALGETSDARIEDASPDKKDDRMYRFNPRPVAPGIPEVFKKPQEGMESAARTDAGQMAEPVDASTVTPTAESSPAPPGTGTVPNPLGVIPWQQSAVSELSPRFFPEGTAIQVFSLHDALGYAMRHSRTFQDAKEDLYLAALALTLERHLWTPQFVATVRADYLNAGQDASFDQALSAVSEASVTQRLPWGGNVSARVIGNLMRDLTDHVTTGETGQTILSAELPLLRGAGPSAFESRYQAERDLIYAVRQYEQFRRAFVVEVASSYFELQGLRSAVNNTYVSYESRKHDAQRAEFIENVGQAREISEAPRAKSSLRQAEAGLISSKEVYVSALDRFKVFLGMAVEASLDVVSQDEDQESKDIDILLREVDQDTAIETALKLRLDLLNALDQVDDERRGVRVAKNAILPDLNADGNVTLDTNPDKLGTFEYDTTERTDWRAGIELRMDDRKRERNAYRQAQVILRRAERNYQLQADNIRVEIRRAMRRIAQQANLRAIQELNVAENEFRAAAAREQFNLGKSTNQDVVDAENDLLAARNDLSQAVAAYRVAILEFRRETGTLRVTDEGVISTE